MKILKKHLFSVICISLLVAIIAASVLPPARAEGGGIAVVDAVYVIDSSVPGKEAQRRMDNFKTATDAERASYVKSVIGKPDSIALIDAKDIEFSNKNTMEFARLSTIMRRELRKAIEQWFGEKGKTQNINIVVSSQGILTDVKGVKTIDISNEILAILNGAKPNFSVVQ